MTGRLLPCPYCANTFEASADNVVDCARCAQHFGMKACRSRFVGSERVLDALSDALKGLRIAHATMEHEGDEAIVKLREPCSPREPRCTCDDFCDGPCPAQAMINRLVDIMQILRSEDRAVHYWETIAIGAHRCKFCDVVTRDDDRDPAPPCKYSVDAIAEDFGREDGDGDYTLQPVLAVRALLREIDRLTLRVMGQPGRKASDD